MPSTHLASAHSSNDLTAADHDGHRYSTASIHHTSQGRIAYQRCTCGTWRIQRYPRHAQPVTEAVLGGLVYRWVPPFAALNVRQALQL